MTRLLILLAAGAALFWVAPVHSDSTEALHVLRTVAGLETGAVSVDCYTQLDARDALYLLRETAGLPNADCIPPREIRARLQNEALTWWTANGDDISAVQNIPVYWTLKGTYLDGLAGYATPDFMVLCGECYDIWGYDWMLSVLIHEYGHALGYAHGDPVCPMNPAYC